MDKNDFKILIAEDEEIVRDVISKFLTGEGYHVITANDGLSAIKLLRLEDIKLVLSDLRMPGADGMEVLRTAMQVNPKISVVLMTAYGTLDTALEAMKEGAYDYIVKPFVMQQLLLVVRNAYRMAALFEENDKLSNQLKETYRDLENYKATGRPQKETPPNVSATMIDSLKELNIINEEESVSLKARTSTGNVNENIKKYSSLVNDLTNNKT